MGGEFRVQERVEAGTGPVDPAPALVRVAEGDLVDLADAWGGLLPDAAFVSPHAPEPCIQGFGRQPSCSPG
jgi:hypothetical protein